MSLKVGPASNQSQVSPAPRPSQATGNWLGRSVRWLRDVTQLVLSPLPEYKRLPLAMRVVQVVVQGARNALQAVKAATKAAPSHAVREAVRTLVNPARPTKNSGGLLSALQPLTDAAAGRLSARDAVKSALLGELSRMPASQAQSLLVSLRLNILNEGRAGLIRSHKAVVLAIEAAADQVLQAQSILPEALKDLERAHQPRAEIVVNGQKMDTGVGEGLWKDMKRATYHSVDSAGNRTTPAHRPNREDMKELHEALLDLAARTTGGDMQRLCVIGRYAMQSLWEPPLRIACTQDSPFRVNGEPGILNGPCFNEYEIQVANDDIGGHFVNATILYEGSESTPLKFQSLKTGKQEQLDPGSRARGTMKIRVLPDGSARCEKLPEFKCELIRDPDGMVD